MTESEQRFAKQLSAELGRILGTGIILDELDLGPTEDDPSRIRAICLFDGRTEVLEAEGETRLEAYNRLVRAAAELRLTMATRNMIAPT